MAVHTADRKTTSTHNAKNADTESSHWVKFLLPKLTVDNSS